MVQNNYTVLLVDDDITLFPPLMDMMLSARYKTNPLTLSF